MKLSDLLSEKYILLGLETETKSRIIDMMLSLVSNHPNLTNEEKLRRDVLKREEEMSTGIGKSIALPHAKTDAVTEPILAFAVLKKSVDFDAIDNRPVRFVFLLATPELMLAQHLKLLSRISRVAGREDIQEKIAQAKSPADVLDVFSQEEKAFPEI
ncbi:MAG: PTS sugar transporter subunit IIA [Chlorobiales bacterium]|jgi:fructose-specific phosphotransferase system IIA component|nr:PTS sugar transporter subunit IIA [Chlorobiales bacterium]